MFTKKNQLKRILVDKRIKDAGEVEKACSAEGIQICHTKSETKAAFADRTTGYLKIILYCIMEDHVCKYVHKTSQLVTALNSRKKVDKSRLFKRPDSRECYEFRLFVHSV